MNEFYFSVNLDNDRMLCLAPLSDRRIAMSGQELEDTSGYFLFEQSHSDEFGGVKILARVLSEDGVMQLREMFSMA